MYAVTTYDSFLKLIHKQQVSVIHSLFGHCEVLIYIHCERNTAVAVMYRNNISEPRSHGDLNYSHDRWIQVRWQRCKAMCGCDVLASAHGSIRNCLWKMPRPQHSHKLHSLISKPIPSLKVPKDSSTSKEAIYPSIYPVLSRACLKMEESQFGSHLGKGSRELLFR